MSLPPLNRRGLLGLGSALLLSGCDRLAQDPRMKTAFGWAEQASYRAHRLLIGGHALAPEFSAADISSDFRANGTTDIAEPAYKKMAGNGFSGWALTVDGLVDSPRKFTLAQLRALPSREQITRHDCVEGWSSIGRWKGALLSAVLDAVKPKDSARFVVFHCVDRMGGSPMEAASNDDDDKDEKDDDGKTDAAAKTDAGDDKPESGGPLYYESIDLVDARHPQTILAYEMNGKVLPVAHGAPLRVRVERQLGYKMAKYIMRIELVDDLSKIGEGKGGYWEDQGYDWYAGV